MAANFKTEIIAGVPVWKDLDGTVVGVQAPVGNGFVQSIRQRFTIAQVNAGATLLAALPGFKYRMIQCSAIAVGGAVAAVTTVDVLGTQATSSVKLVAFAQASLTQSTELRAGDTGGTILADGASFAACDENTPITVDITGAAITTATHVDFILEFVADKA